MSWVQIYPMATEYQVIERSSLRGLQDAVNEFLSCGARLQGGIGVSPSGYVQAICLSPSREPESIETPRPEGTIEQLPTEPPKGAKGGKTKVQIK